MKEKNNRKSQAKISSCYRLKPSTQKLVKQVCLRLNSTHDKIFSIVFKHFKRETGI